MLAPSPCQRQLSDSGPQCLPPSCSRPPRFAPLAWTDVTWHSAGDARSTHPALEGSTMPLPNSMSSRAGFSTSMERRVALVALSLSWLVVLGYLTLLLTNIVRFFIERAETTSYGALFAWWLALPG